MEYRELETFLTLAETRSFTRTAEQLQRSVGRISQTIKTLERRIGALLIERSTRPVTLTPLGQQLYKDVHPAATQLSAAWHAAVTAGRSISGALHVGFVGAVAGEILRHGSEKFRTEHPQCTISAREVQMRDALSMLHSDAVQILIACKPLHDDSLSAGPTLLRERRFLAVPSTHRLAQAAQLSIEDLARHRVLQAPCFLPDYWRTPREELRTPGGRGIALGPRADTFQEILALIADNQGIFPVGEHVSQYYPHPRVTYVPLADAPKLKWCAFWVSTRVTARVQAFVNTTRSAGSGIRDT